MSFVHPAAFAALLLAAWFVYCSRSSSAGLAPARLRVELGLRLAAFTALTAALAGPRLEIPSSERHFIWLVDVSASASQEGIRRAQDYVQRTGLPGSAGTLLGFGRQAGPLPHERRPGGGEARDMETSVADSCLGALAWFPEGKGRVLTVFTDGVAPGGGFDEAARQLRAHDVALFMVPIPRSPEPEAGVRRIEAPAQVREGEPFSVVAEIVSRGAGEVLAVVEVDGLRAGEKRLSSPAGLERLAFDLRAPVAGRLRVTVAIEPSTDSLPQNNSASAEILVLGRPRVLAISQRGLPEFKDALMQQGISLDVRPAGGLPTGTGSLGGFEAVVIDSDAVSRLSDSDWRRVEQFVEAGGGLVILGGPEAWADGGGEVLKTLLPLAPKAPKVRDIPSLALVLVLDKSGSMQGEKLDMARSAALAALEILSPGDLAGVVVFDGAASWAIELREAGHSADAPARLGLVAAGGGTNLAAGLSAALEGLRAAEARIKHVVVLSDGVSSPGPHRELAARMRAAGISLSTVGVGKDADLVLLDQLARLGGGRFYYTDTAGGLPRIFLRETTLASGSGVSSDPLRVVEVRRAPFLRGLALDQSPLILGHVRTLPSPDASIWLTLEQGDPLLATRRHGLGQVAAWTSSASPPWAAEWIRWPAFGAFWAQLLRGVMPPPGFRELDVRWMHTPGGLRVEAESSSLPADARVEATVSLPGSPGLQTPLQPIVPGLFAKGFALPPPGMCSAKVTAQPAGLPALSGGASTEVRPPDDGVLEEPDWAVLRAFASQAGGVFDPAPEDVAAARPAPRLQSVDLRPWLAAAALAAFLAGLAVRRLRPEASNFGSGTEAG